MAKFVKGQSGNPGGKPAWVKEIAALAQESCPRAIERLAEWLESDNPKASVAAAIALLDRGIGKPSQALEVSGPDGGAAGVVVTFVKAGEAK